MLIQADGCIGIGEDDEIDSLTMGRICSFYYLKHQTMGLFATMLKPEMNLKQVCATQPFPSSAVSLQHLCVLHAVPGAESFCKSMTLRFAHSCQCAHA